MKAVQEDTRKVAMLREAHNAFNHRNFSKAVELSADTIVYNDRARNVTFNGPDEQTTFMKGWTDAFSDARIENPTYLDAGDTVIAQFTGTGTNDGPVGPYPATGKPMEMAFCEVAHFNEDGKIDTVDMYYDQLTMLSQLGHVEAPASA